MASINPNICYHKNSIYNREITGFGPESELLDRNEEISVRHSMAPMSIQLGMPYLKFIYLKSKWEKETAHLSSITEISMHPAYQQIIGMGPIIIPYILCELQIRPNHWFWALKSITGEDPVPAEKKGLVKEMISCWLNWWKYQENQRWEESI